MPSQLDSTIGSVVQASLTSEHSTRIFGRSLSTCQSNTGVLLKSFQYVGADATGLNFDLL
jgi:hypothetical protein